MPTTAPSTSSSDSDAAERPAKRARLATSDDASGPSPRNGHVVNGKIKMAGSSVHIGDQYYQVQQPLHVDTAESDEATNKILIKSLLFDRIDARMLNVKQALQATCEWLLAHSLFQEWYTSRDTQHHNGILWIKGKPGCGKSTLTKMALKWVQTKARRMEKKPLIAYYFFNARAGTSLEKSCLGLYRSLVYQLVSAHSSVRELFITTFALKAQSDLAGTWCMEELRNFLLEVVALPDLVEMFFLIDALDEGDDESHIRQMLSFLEELYQSSLASDPPCRLRIFLSSRHYPHITVRKALSLVVEDQAEHAQDIDIYIRNKLNGADTTEGSTLCAKLQRKSSGIFLWIELVVEILNKIHDSGGLPSDMHARLEDIPGDLNDLFKEILSRSTENVDPSIALFQWVLYSIRPLSAPELYLAMQHTFSSNGCIDTRVSEGSVLSEEYLQKYILNCSRGLVELTSSEPPEVQFIHESVREFLTGNDGLTILRPPLSANLPGISHGVLKNTCQSYLTSVTVPAEFERFETAGYGTLQNFRGLYRDLVSQRPFIEYCTRFLFNHAEEAERNGVSQDHFLASITDDRGFWHGKHRIWWNILECFQINKYDTRTTVLYFAATQGYPCLVAALSKFANAVNVRCGRYGSALHAACACGNEQVNEQVVRTLLEAGANIAFEDSKVKPVLLTAISKKNFALVPLLQDRGAVLSPELLQKALISMVTRNSIEGIQLLLRMGAKLTKPGSGRCIGLENLITNERPGACEVVLQHLINDGCPQHLQDIAVIAAAKFGFEKALSAHLHNHNRTLLSYKYRGATALHWASLTGSHRAVRILIDAGADINAITSSNYYSGGRIVGGSALTLAASKPCFTTVQVLLEAGADVNARGGCWRTALEAATSRKSSEMMRVLLKAGAEVNAPPGASNALQVAASHGGGAEMMKILLEAGADVNAQGGYYGNALQAAVHNRNLEVVRILLKAGANVNARGGKFGSALNAARELPAIRRDAIENLLLAAGATE